MIVNAIICQRCKDTIYSRARHDCRPCTCGNVYIDGGFDYTRIGVRNNGKWKQTKIDVAATKKGLYNDWASGRDRFGLIVEKFLLQDTE